MKRYFKVAKLEIKYFPNPKGKGYETLVWCKISKEIFLKDVDQFTELKVVKINGQYYFGDIEMKSSGFIPYPSGTVILDSLEYISETIGISVEELNAIILNNEENNSPFLQEIGE